MAGARGLALLGLLLLGGAVLFDGRPLYVGGVALVVLGAGTAGWVRLAARGAALRRSVPARTAVEGEPISVRVELAAGTLPLPGGELAEPLLGRTVRVPAGRGGVRLRIETRFARRGRRRLEPPRAIIGDPLDLSAVTLTGPRADEVLVLPRVEPVLRLDPGGGRGAAGERGRQAIAAETEMDGLRPHRPGTPASRIHWPSLARGDELMERRMRPDADGRPLVALDPRAPAREADLDAAVRATASLAVHLAGAGGCSVLLPGDRRPSDLGPELHGWPALHARLAMLDEGAGRLRPGAGARRGAVFLVSARVDASSAAAWRATAGGGVVLFVPGMLPRRRARFEVAGCRGYDLRRAGQPAVPA